MYETMTFQETPYNTIRVFVYYYEKYPDYKIDHIFNFLSIWGGEDKNYLKNERRVKSWEFPVSLRDFFKDKYQHNTDVDIKGLG